MFDDAFHNGNQKFLLIFGLEIDPLNMAVQEDGNS